MNHVLIGNADKTDRLIELADRHFLLIDDGEIADAFLDQKRCRLFDITKHSFNPLKGIDYKGARDIAAALYTASPEGKDTLTVRNGKRALTRLLLGSPTRFDKLPTDTNDPGATEALATVDDMLLSPVVRRVLCNPTNFSFKGSVVLKLDRAEIGDFDAFILAALAIGQFQGQVIVPDFGFYGRDFYGSLIRQNRFLGGVQFLGELPQGLQKLVLLIKDIEGAGCLFDDAEVLAKYARMTPGTNGYNSYIDRLME